MKTRATNINFLGRGDVLGQTATTGISLHCHSLHSKELLDFVPYYAERIPIVRNFWRAEMKRREREYGRTPDFKSGYWEPPLTGSQVYESETASLARLGLDAVVSITDHDSINANLELRADGLDVPISLEWTVPFADAFFHLGIHNLPPDRAEEITRDLLAYTHAKGEPDATRLLDLFSLLNEMPEVLVVLNHPIWDIEMIGQQRHEAALTRFLDLFRDWLHALEVNGFRTWEENELVVGLAADLGLPTISGGDRHCCQANTMFNITDATSFSEFVSEIRVDRRSQIAVTPEYHVPLPSRQLRSMAQILDDRVDFPEGRKLWSDRIFLDAQDGLGLRSLTDQWNGHRPLWSWVALFALDVMSQRWVRPLIAMSVGDTDIGREASQPTPTQGRIGQATPVLDPGIL